MNTIKALFSDPIGTLRGNAGMDIFVQAWGIVIVTGALIFFFIIKRK